jgi:hypothetical protein
LKLETRKMPRRFTVQLGMPGREHNS